MKKKYFIFAASALALASCSSDDFVGDGQENVKGSNAAINFNSSTNNVTRATGSNAANLLNKKFVVYGYKTMGESKSTVYDHYNVNYIENSAGKTESNKADWEYVGQAINSLNSTTGSEQTIKYWDYAASQYDFVAFSFGQATQGDGENDVTASKVDNTKPEYSLTGKSTELAKCYIADRVTAKKDVTNKKANKLVSYGDPVQFNFRSLASKVKIGIYETIPGYSIKDVKFYTKTDDNDPKTTPTLYSQGNKIPDMTGNGTMTVTFGSNDDAQTDFNQAKVAWTVNGTDVSKIAFENLGYYGGEKYEEGNTGVTTAKYIGRNAVENCSTVDYQNVLPAKVGPLTLKVDYTLVSIDGSKEEIKVKGANAVVPEQFTNWKANYAYTYIFKISDNTNGYTGDDPSKSGLYPITFDAIVTATEDGFQNTVTNVHSPSITTYAKGTGNTTYPYYTGEHIYIALSDGTLNTTNTALYTANMNKGTAPITEAYVELCLKQKTEGDTNTSWSLDDGTNELTVSNEAGLDIVSEIASSDVADGNAISGTFAKFTPTAAGTYVFEYTQTITPAAGGSATTVKHYKVITVKNPS